jgi:GST-like protein
MIDLYAIGTNNGQLAAIMLEETGCPYTHQPLDMMKGAHREPAYLAINPVGKIPAIVDHDGPDGETVTVFETLAIALYLCDKTGKLMPSDLANRALAYKWAAVAAADLAPTMSVMFQLRRNVSDTCGPSIEYLGTQVDRYLATFEGRLAEADYLAGEFSFADVQVYPIVAGVTPNLPKGLEPYPNLQRWSDAVRARPAVERGMTALPPLS